MYASGKAIDVVHVLRIRPTLRLMSTVRAAQAPAASSVIARYTGQLVAPGSLDIARRFPHVVGVCVWAVVCSDVGGVAYRPIRRRTLRVARRCSL